MKWGNPSYVDVSTSFTDNIITQQTEVFQKLCTYLGRFPTCWSFFNFNKFVSVIDISWFSVKNLIQMILCLIEN